MVSREQAIEIAICLARSRAGKDYPVLNAYRVAGDWVVALEFEPGLDPCMLVKVNIETGEASFVTGLL